MRRWMQLVVAVPLVTVAGVGLAQAQGEPEQVEPNEGAADPAVPAPPPPTTSAPAPAMQPESAEVERSETTPARQSAEVSGSVQLSARAGDESPYGLLFNLNNVFTAAGVLGGYQGFGFGGLMEMPSGTVVRLGATVVRATDPVNIVKNTQINGDDTVVSYELQLPPGGWSATHAFSLAADALFPLSTREVYPYWGGGLLVGFVAQDLDYTDEVTVTDQVTEVDDSSDTLSTGVRGILGVGWEISRNFSLFAEYHLVVEMFAYQSMSGQTTVNNTSSGTPASSRTQSEFSESRFFNVRNGLGQGASLGLIAYF